MLLQVAPPLRGARRGRPAGPLQPAPLHCPHADRRRGRRQDRLPAPALPLRPGEDLDVPEALPRRRRSATRGCGGSSSASSMNRLPASQRYKRHERPVEALREAAARPPRPGRREVHRAARPAAGARSYYQYTAIDDCTRIRVLRIYPRNNQKTAIQFIDYVLEKLPFPSRSSRPTTAPSSKAPSTGTSSTAASATSTSNPRTPRLNGKVERSHRIDAEEFYRLLDGVVIDDTELFNDKLQEWEDFYNFHRPHGGLGGQTPYERLRQKNQRPRRKPPTSVAQSLSRSPTVGHQPK